MTPLPPPVPPRPRFGSEPHTDISAVMGVVLQIQRDIATNEAETKTALATLGEKVSKIEASRNDQLVKLIGVVVTAIATAVAGSRMVAPTPPPTQTVLQRTAADQAIDVCATIQDAVQRAKCAAEVALQTVDARAHR